MDEDLQEVLRRIIDDWKDKEKGRSLALLADTSKISYPYIRKLANGDASSPSLEIVIQLLVQISHPTSSILEIIRHFFPDQYQHYSKVFSFALISSAGATCELSQLHYRIICEIVKPGGCSLEKVQHLAGAQTEPVLEKLQVSGLARIEGREVVSASTQLYWKDLQSILHFMRIGLDRLDLAVKGNQAESRVCWINDESMIWAYWKLWNTKQEIISELSKPENAGENGFLFGVFSTKL